jgi:predicted nuclease of predicted toxin-antitoxin system
VNLLIDENMPRSLAAILRASGLSVWDVREIGLRGQSDDEVLKAAIGLDAVIVTRDRGFTAEARWPTAFSSG